MGILLSLIAFLVIFSVIILVHEWGHFQVARRNGITVEEFGIGLPPRIWGKKINGVLYSVNWIPFGGFVRLFGEDTSDPQYLRTKNAFVAQPLSVRAKVVCAGVFMNFLLAVLLLTVGFSFGIRPLIVGTDDLLAGIASGHITVEPGILIKDVQAGTPASSANIESGDRIVALFGRPVTDPSALEKTLKSSDNLELSVQRNEQSFSVFFTRAHEEKGFGIIPHDLVLLSRVFLENVSAHSPIFQNGLRSGDVLLTLGGEEIYTPDDFQRRLQTGDDLSYTVYRNHAVFEGEIVRTKPSFVVVTDILPDGSAAKAGFLPGDRIVRVDDKSIVEPSDLVGLPQGERTYVVLRNGKEMAFPLMPNEQGFIGVIVAPLFDTSLLSGLQFYPTTQITSVTKISPVRYPIWKAPIAALSESVRLSKLTVQMFGGILQSLFARFEVPDGIAGPVGIAQLTHSFVQEGFLSLIRFAALLSLSLAVINILPIPALDGGRLLFILIEFIRGKSGNLKVERMAHSIGFTLLILLLLAVTYKDILRLIAS